VGIGTNQQTTWESVVLEENLVDDTRSWLPETNVVLGASSGKEVVNLLVDVDSAGKILGATNLGFDKMVAVDGGWVGDGWHTGRHELHDGHLSSGVLASNAIWAKLEVGDTTLDLLVVWIIQMGVENLLGIGERAVEARSHDGEVLGHLLVVDVVALLVDVLGNLPVERRVADGRHSAAKAILCECSPLSGTKKLSRCQHCGGGYGGCGLEEERREGEERKKVVVELKRRLITLEARLLVDLALLRTPTRLPSLPVLLRGNRV
jgi:hypothetical protein